jgi:hypothetical protein
VGREGAGRRKVVLPALGDGVHARCKDVKLFSCRMELGPDGALRESSRR